MLTDTLNELNRKFYATALIAKAITQPGPLDHLFPPREDVPIKHPTLAKRLWWMLCAVRDRLRDAVAVLRGTKFAAEYDDWL